MKYMDKLPTVISCCFCCFLRAGTVMIGLFSFFIGIIFAPNVSQTPGFWDMDTLLSNYNTATENAIQISMGMISVFLCFISVLLVIGAFCNFPILIEIYQWGALVYSSTVVFLFSILAIFCFFIHANCFLAGGVLCGLIICVILLTAYFIMVVNSLRMSLKYLAGDEAEF